MAHKIEQLLDKILSWDQSWHQTLIRNWHTIIGPLHSKVQLEKIEAESLVLGVYDSCWMQELYLLTPLLLRTINQKLDQPRIKQLRFKTVGKHKTRQAATQTTAIKKAKTVELTKREKDALQQVEDPQLQEALKRFLIRCYQEK
jgi:hypothetical protein